MDPRGKIGWGTQSKFRHGMCWSPSPLIFPPTQEPLVNVQTMMMIMVMKIAMMMAMLVLEGMIMTPINSANWWQWDINVHLQMDALS